MVFFKMNTLVDRPRNGTSLVLARIDNRELRVYSPV